MLSVESNPKPRRPGILKLQDTDHSELFWEHKKYLLHIKQVIVILKLTGEAVKKLRACE